VSTNINVLVVDDSAVVRQVVSGILQAEPDITVCAAVADPIFAMQRMRLQWPDVIVLDVEMPRMDGITFLRKIMSERPTPVVICSTLTREGADSTIQALAAGAVAVVPKPKTGMRDFLPDASEDLLDAVRAASRADVRKLLLRRPGADVEAYARRTLQPSRAGTPGVVAIGASTGGTQTLEYVLAALPPRAPGIAIVQHMPEQFTAAFARRLDAGSRIEVREAQDGDRVLPGRALVAPGGRHMTLARDAAGYAVQVRMGPPVNRHRPSVDVLFRSAARHAGADALGIIMTGMGSDGAYGLLEMRAAGARTVAQDEASCVVFGMPREAMRLGAVERIVTLDRIPGFIAGGDE
jgi:two-component system, chemotaxis family, protein-glutamate methylesterase/glutaminase